MPRLVNHAHSAPADLLDDLVAVCEASLAGPFSSHARSVRFGYGLVVPDALTGLRSGCGRAGESVSTNRALFPVSLNLFPARGAGRLVIAVIG